MKRITITKHDIFSFLVNAVIFGCLGAVSAYTLIASDTGFTPKDTTWEVDNVKDALDDLYDKRMVDDIKLNISDISTISMNVSTNESFENATYIYLLNKRIISSSNENSYTIENLEPETSYILGVIVYTEDGKVHIGTKRQSTADAVWLYKDGTKYDISGGFSIKGYVGSDNYTLTDYDSYMRLNVPSNKRATFIRENTIIDFSKYKKVYVKYYNSNSNHSCAFISSRDNYNGYDSYGGEYNFNYNSPGEGDQLAIFDVSSLTASAYIYLRKTHAGYIDIQRIWLEE